MPDSTKNNTSGYCNVAKRHKLALFVQLCYLVDGRNGRDHPNIEILIHNSSSQQAGENRLSQVFSGARGQLRSIAGATLVGSTMLLGSLTACAQDNSAPDTSSAPQTVATKLVADAGSIAPIIPTNTGGEARIYNAASTAPTPPAQNASINSGADTAPLSPMTPKEVREFSKKYDAVIYHGDNIFADSLARGFRKIKGYNVVNVSGLARADTAMIVIKGKPILKFYTQDDVDRGVLGAKIMDELDIPIQTASLIPAGLD